MNLPSDTTSGVRAGFLAMPGLPESRPSEVLAWGRQRAFGTGPRHRRWQGQDGGTPIPAKSKAQQKAAGAALSAKRGETKVSDLKGAAKSMHQSMSGKELEELAETSRKGLPEHKRQDRD